MAQRNYDLPEEFLDAADRFVALANELGGDRPLDRVRAMMMYATARSNAFNWVTRDEAPEQTLEEALVYFAGEYRIMLRENITELEPVYRASGNGGSTQ